MKNIQITTGILAALLILIIWQADAQSPKGRTGTFALTNATIETVTKGIINNGTVIIRNGLIEDVGTNIQVPDGAEVINCNGFRIYPGMIDGGTQLGLTEVGSDAKTQDFNERGEVVPQMKALTAVNPNSALIPVARVNGITTVIAKPEGGLLPGTAALINLHGYTPDQMYAGYEGVILNFPNTGRRGFFDRRSDDEIKKAAEKSLEQLNEVWDRAVQYHKLDSSTRGKGLDYYPEMVALLPVVRGQRMLMIEVNTAKDILSAMKWVQEKNISKVVLTGVSEGWRVADAIAKAKMPVITGPVVTLPSREYDRYDQAYANAGMMQKAGVKVAIRSADSENVRNLPYHAGFAVAYGMDKQEALKAVTITPAEIFGVADKMGSIEKGKVANLFVCNGDPFETKTEIKQVFIAGWMVPLVTRHTLLYDEFLKREPGVSKE
ncbi:MAG: amidohydrolase family protein [Cyclobacteriaceae bacterium]